jgi:hypothetical protein
VFGASKFTLEIDSGMRLMLWMEKTRQSLSRKSDTAVGYALSHWRALTRYVDDGLMEIDNSAAERVRRAVAIERSLCPSF